MQCGINLDMIFVFPNECINMNHDDLYTFVHWFMRRACCHYTQLYMYSRHKGSNIKVHRYKYRHKGTCIQVHA